MFGKKTCGRCKTSVRSKYSFCPYCGSQLEVKSEDLGMLGKNDFISETNFNGFKIPPGFNLLFNSLAKNLEKQFKDIDKKAINHEASNKVQPSKKGHITISITSAGNKMPDMRIHAPVPKNLKREIKRASFEDLSAEQLKKFSSLPKEEPKTNIRRLSNKVLYELDIPGVKSAKDISILNLEKGVELKALSDKKAYLKSIPISLPIINYKLSKGKLVLEMDARN